MSGALAQAAHLVWSAKGPDLLTSLRRRWPHRVRPGIGWYHDYPTLVLALLSAGSHDGGDPRRQAGGGGRAGTSGREGTRRGGTRAACLFPKATSAPTLGSTVTSAGVSASAGAAFHAASVRILAGRRPRYRCASLLTADAEQTVLVAAAEEVVWEADVRDGLAAAVLSVAGFGLVHAGLGGRRAVAHMMVFAVLARTVQAWGGVPASICFHGGYNLAHLCDEARPR